MGGLHIFFIFVGIVCIFGGLFMTKKQIEDFREMTGLDPNPTNPFAFVVSLLIVKCPQVITRIFFILIGVALIVFMFALVYI